MTKADTFFLCVLHDNTNIHSNFASSDIKFVKINCPVGNVLSDAFGQYINCKSRLQNVSNVEASIKIWCD